jgi:hypothetical protein
MESTVMGGRAIAQLKKGAVEYYLLLLPSNEPCIIGGEKRGEERR